MKKLAIILTMVFFLTFTSGCLFTRLTIYNNTSTQLNNVNWNGYNYGTLSIGQSESQSVDSGQGFVYFSYAGYNFHTADYISVEQGDDKKFTLTDYTYVYGPLATKNPSIAQIKDIIVNPLVSDIR